MRCILRTHEDATRKHHDPKGRTRSGHEETPGRRSPHVLLAGTRCAPRVRFPQEEKVNDFFPLSDCVLEDYVLLAEWLSEYLGLRSETGQVNDGAARRSERIEPFRTPEAATARCAVNGQSNSPVTIKLDVNTSLPDGSNPTAWQSVSYAIPPSTLSARDVSRRSTAYLDKDCSPRHHHPWNEAATL